MATEDHTPLSNILSDEPTETIPAAPEPEEPQEPALQPRDESGRFAKKGEEEGASPAPVETPQDDPPFDHAAVKGERNRRQAAEQERDNFRAELDALKQQFQQLQQPREPQAPPPSIWEDEQGWRDNFGAQVVQQASFNAALNLSEMLTRKENAADFDEMKARFLSIAEQNPAVVQQALSDPDPWGKAYRIAKNAATMESLGATDLETLKAKMREEVMAELQQGQSPVPQAQVTLPPSLTGERNVGSRSGPAWAGPTPLKQMLA